MGKLILRNIILVAFIFFSSSFNNAFAVTKEYDSITQRLIIKDAKLGEPFKITQTDLAQLIADKSDSPGNFDIRIAFDANNQQKIIDEITNEPGNTIGENKVILEVLKTEDPKTHNSFVRFASVKPEQLSSGALTRLSVESVITMNGITQFLFNAKALGGNLGNRIPIFNIEIDNSTTYSGDFDIVINFEKGSEKITGSIGDFDSSTSSMTGGGFTEEDFDDFNFASNYSEAILQAAGGEKRAKEILSISFNCGNLGQGFIDICDESKEAEDKFKEGLNEALEEVEFSKKRLLDLKKIVKRGLKEKSITKSSAKRVLKKLGCAFRSDNFAIKSIEKQIKKQDKLLEEGKNKLLNSSDSIGGSSVPGSVVSSADKVVIKINRFVNSAERRLSTGIKCKREATLILEQQGIITNGTADEVSPF